jgi:hypothetical protein
MVAVKHFALLACLGLFLVGCSSPAEVKNMTINQSALVSSVSDTPFKGALAVKQVNGGEETNPLWTSEVGNAEFREAFRGSILQSGLLAPTSLEEKYDVYATLAALDQPLFGLDLKVTSRVDYRVIERDGLKTWFDDSVVSSYTATFSDAAFAIQRLRLANEGSIRENITAFIQRLVAVEKPQD